MAYYKLLITINSDWAQLDIQNGDPATWAINPSVTSVQSGEYASWNFSKNSGLGDGPSNYTVFAKSLRFSQAQNTTYVNSISATISTPQNQVVFSLNKGALGTVYIDVLDGSPAQTFNNNDPHIPIVLKTLFPSA
jgi:hypothetical protein